MTIVLDRGTDVEVSGAWNFPNPEVFSRLLPRTFIDTGHVVP